MTTPAERDAAPPLFTRTERFVIWATSFIILLGLIALLLWHVVFVRIQPGFVGVRYSLLDGGTVTDEVLGEGINYKLPWDLIYPYELRIQRMPVEVIALSVEGMNVRIAGAVLYQPKKEQVAHLHQDVGPEYEERVVNPISVAAIREVTAKFGSQELYSIDYDELKNDVLQEIRNQPIAEMVDFEDVAFIEVRLPTEISTAIEQKLTQEQLAAAYEFRLEREKQEAERKRIEAIGIRTFYSIVNEALNQGLLTWRGIEATVELAKSDNTKIVIVGGGQDQLPLILGSDIANTPAQRQAVTDATSPSNIQLPNLNELPPLFDDASSTINSLGTPTLAIGQGLSGTPETTDAPTENDTPR